MTTEKPKRTIKTGFRNAEKIAKAGKPFLLIGAGAGFGAFIKTMADKLQEKELSDDEEEDN